MFLVLCGSDDQPARWLYEGLGARGVAPLELITTDQLAFARVWEHRLGECDARLRIVLDERRSLRSDQITGVFNRLLGAPTGLVNLGRSQDRAYAVQELGSFYLSWLHGLPGNVIGRTEPGGFCGRWRHMSEWAVLAKRAGLPVPPYRQSADDEPEAGWRSLTSGGAEVKNVIALKERLFGENIPDKTGEACLRLANLAGNDVLGLSLFRDNGDWSLAGATVFPDLTCGGAALLDHTAMLMQKQGLQ